MPCDSGMGGNVSYGDLRQVERQCENAIKETDRVTDILCSVLRALPKEMVDSMDQKTKDWFEEHKKHDAKHGR